MIVYCHLGDGRHHADDGLLICVSHLQELNTYLRDVEEEAAHLDACPSAEMRLDEAAATLASQQSPVRLTAVAADDPRRGTPALSPWSHDDYLAYDETLSVYDTVHQWAQRVRNERDLRAPARLTVVTERQLLTAHLEWIATRVWVRPLYLRVRKLREQLKATNGTSDPKPLPGRCPLPGPDGICGGPLWDVKPLHTAGDWDGPGPTAVECASCLERWEGPQQLALLAISTDVAKREAAEGKVPAR